jgi:RES domain-containing protein
VADRRTIYRITHERYADEPFSGKGGLHYRSRWASKGQLVSCASDHLATATLEKVAEVGRPDLLTEMVYVKAEVDQALVDELPEAELPEDWDVLPPTDATRHVGDRWLGDQANLFPDVSALSIVDTSPLLLDNRALRQLRSTASED